MHQISPPNFFNIWKFSTSFFYYFKFNFNFSSTEFFSCCRSGVSLNFSNIFIFQPNKKKFKKIIKFPIKKSKLETIEDDLRFNFSHNLIIIKTKHKKIKTLNLPWLLILNFLFSKHSDHFLIYLILLSALQVHRSPILIVPRCDERSVRGLFGAGKRLISIIEHH